MTSETDLRQTVHFYLHDRDTRLGKAIDLGIILLNAVFVLVYVAETYTSGFWASLLWDIEVGITLVFVVEYVARIYSADDRLRQTYDVYSVIDLVSILPTLLILVFSTTAVAGLSFLRVLRILRIFRFLRFLEDEKFFFGTVSEESLRGARLLTTVFIIFFVTAGFFYAFENTVNPEVNTFGDSLYFTVVALSTVGFGDIVPTTRLGRLTAVLGITAGIIFIPWQASRIIRTWTHEGKVSKPCPDCGTEYHDPDAVYCRVCGAEIESDG